MTAIGDYDGASYADITRSTSLHQPTIGTTASLGFAPLAGAGAFLRAGHVTDYSTGSGVQGDMNVFGRVYMSTVGRGLVYGNI